MVGSSSRSFCHFQGGKQILGREEEAYRSLYDRIGDLSLCCPVGCHGIKKECSGDGDQCTCALMQNRLHVFKNRFFSVPRGCN
ncbi:unnamed protein product [Tetraodon nigroviridis]|uniref:(spotted green pufferfish) hypothetical protein n=1 Tax=Tetraodon nigroviridis TaxID=99883 RepID=Q4SZI6_TETNG|nr:unnamed protein product [Tetraodon nigroviridis]